MQGIGGIEFLMNFRLIPFFLPLKSLFGSVEGKVAVYVLIAMAIFASVYWFARRLSASVAVAIIAGWILGVIATPVDPWPAIFYPILYVGPAFVLVVLWPIAIFGVIQAIGRGTILSDILLGGALVGLFLYVLGASPFLGPIIGVATIPYVALSLVMVRDGVELRRKLIGLVGVLAVAVGLRLPWYVFG